MSSPLDARIRRLAREEIQTGGSPTADGADRVAALEKEVADLRTVVQRLDARLDAYEKTAGLTDQEEKTTTRRTRKTAGTE